MKKQVMLFVAIVLLSVFTTACYAHGPWRGKVVDAETKEPIEGAAVVAEWTRSNVAPAGRIDRLFRAVETKTNQNGDFEIPSSFSMSLPLFREIEGPYFVIYKPGYMSYPEQQVSPKITPPKIFLGKGAVIELPKALTVKDRAASAWSARSRLDWIPSENKKRFLELYTSEKELLEKGKQ